MEDVSFIDASLRSEYRSRSQLHRGTGLVGENPMKACLIRLAWWLWFRFSSDRWFWGCYDHIMRSPTTPETGIKQHSYLMECERRNKIADERMRVELAKEALRTGKPVYRTYIMDENRPTAAEVIQHLDGPDDPDLKHPSRL